MARDDVSKRVEKRNKLDQSGKIEKKSAKMNNYEKAKLVYEQIQETKRIQKEERIQAQIKKQEAKQQYLSQKKKMGKAIRKHNKKGQPNLGAQMEAILGKIEKRMND